MSSLLLNPKDIAEIQVENFEKQGEWWIMLVTSLSIACAFIACGSWCIYAARKIKEEESVYHFEGEFMPDDENPSRKSKKAKMGFSKKTSKKASARTNAGSDMSEIEIGEESEKKENLEDYFKALARSLIP